MPKNRNAFVSHLAARQGQALNRFLASRLRNALTEVPDLVQEVFLRMLRVKQLDSIQSPEAYLFAIARHVLHQHRAQSSGTPPAIDIADVLSELEAAHGAGPEAQAEIRERVERFHEALSEMPPNVYATLMLNRVAGLTLEEVAERLGVSRGMAKKYLAAALERCRETEGASRRGQP